MVEGEILEEVDLRQVQVRLIERSERVAWDRLMAQHHYLGFRALVGESLRYVAHVQGRWLALLGWCTGALQCGARDRWVGWARWMQRQRLVWVANHARFLLLPGPRVANLASRVLALNVRCLSQDWQRHHGHGIALAETFVDPRYFRATCYRAAGWQELGSTRGFARRAGRYVAHGVAKRVWVRELDRALLAQLADPMASELFERGGGRMSIVLSNRQAENLWAALLQVPDFRRRQGRRHSRMNILALAICAVLGGARSMTAIACAAQRLPQRLLRRMGCRFNERTKRYEVPCEPTIRRFLKAVSPQGLEEAMTLWLGQLGAAQSTTVAIDGKTKRSARQEDGLVHLLSAFAVQTGVVLAQRAVPAHTNEIPEAPKLLKSLPLKGKVGVGDAMHTQKELARFLAFEKQADYCFTVKDNQPTMRQEIASYFPDPAGAFPPSARND